MKKQFGHACTSGGTIFRSLKKSEIPPRKGAPQLVGDSLTLAAYRLGVHGQEAELAAIWHEGGGLRSSMFFVALLHTLQTLALLAAHQPAS